MSDSGDSWLDLPENELLCNYLTLGGLSIVNIPRAVIVRTVNQLTPVDWFNAAPLQARAFYKVISL